MPIDGLEIIDTHMHYGADPAIAEHLTVPYLVYDDPESVIRCLDEYNISKVVLVTPDRVLNPPSDFDFTQANEAVARAATKYPDRILGAIRINPLFGEEFVWTTIKHFVEERGMRGLGELVARADFYNPTSSKVVGPMMEAAAYYSIPVMFHSGHASRDLPSLQAYTAKQYPNTTVVIAHMGLHDYITEAIIAAKETPNVYCDMSQAWPYDIKAFVRAVGAERLMYGSDAPFQSPKVERVKIEECRFTDREMELIFHENAKRIWGIE